MEKIILAYSGGLDTSVILKWLIEKEFNEGNFIIKPEDEDVHTAVENALIAKLGDVGKRIHTARSRNDQVLLDMRLYMKNQILQVAQEAITASDALCKFAERHQEVPMPGSSLMPQKRNPCPLELIRAKSATLQGLLFQTLEMIRALPSGYHRDFQETKRPIMQGLDTTRVSLKVFSKIFPELGVNKTECIASFTPELFTTDQVLKLTSKGIPFRDAYKQVAKDTNDVEQTDPVANILSKQHLGATGNLGISKTYIKQEGYQEWVDIETKQWNDVIKNLLRL